MTLAEGVFIDPAKLARPGGHSHRPRARGRYAHPGDNNPTPLDPNFQGIGVQTTDADGRYRFKTIKPGAYAVGPIMRTPHIHAEVTGPNDRLITQMYFEGEALNQDDMLLKRAWNPETLVSSTRPATADMEQNALAVEWNIVLGWS